MTVRQEYSVDTTRCHIPVMLDEMLSCLSPQDSEIYIDGTFGAGGYTQAILNRAACTVYALDRDPKAAQTAKDMATAYPARLFPIEGRFGDMQALMAAAGVDFVDGIVLDLGVSSMQIDQAERGFSFRKQGPLDMRMSGSGFSAADIVNTASEKDLADIIFTYGEERAARKIARKIVEARAVKRLETTQELTAIVHSVLPMHGGIKTDTATRTFQALRLHVNDEMEELDRALITAEKLLKPNGRLVVVSFHSLEDARVKNFLRDRGGRASRASRHMPLTEVVALPSFALEKSGGLKPSDEEIERNPRSRSARLRWGRRTDAPAEGEGHA